MCVPRHDHAQLQGLKIKVFMIFLIILTVELFSYSLNY